MQVGKAFVARPIQVGRQNDEDVIVTGGLKEGDVVTLENPAESAEAGQEETVRTCGRRSAVRDAPEEPDFP